MHKKHNPMEAEGEEQSWNKCAICGMPMAPFVECVDPEDPEKRICEMCLDTEYATCEHCGKQFRASEDVLYGDENPVCPACQD